MTRASFLRVLSDHFAALIFAVVLVATVARSPQAVAAESEFNSTTIDLGVVVSDVDKAVKFYTEAIGFKEAKGFKVEGPFAAEAGLTDGKDQLDIHVLTLGEDETATRLKLMSFPGKKVKKNENDAINSEQGFRYLTLRVVDTNAALARLKKAGVKPLAKGPAAIPANIGEGQYLTVVRDPDGNLVELVGPKK